MGIRDRLKGKASTPGGGDYPDTIKFEDEGDEVAGIVTAVRENVQTDYGDATVIAVDDEIRGEEIAFFATNHNLIAGLLDGENDVDRKVAKGDEVYVRYEGKSQTKNGNTVKNFAIAVSEGDASEVDGAGDDADDDDDKPF